MTEQIIKEIGLHVRKETLLTDFTGVKISTCKAMRKYSKSDVIGGHPLFGPGVELKGKNFVICKVRSEKHWNLYKELLESLELKVVVMSPEEHDKQLNFNIKSEILTPAFLLKRSVIGRMLSQDPNMYAEIETTNPYAKKIIKSYLKTTKDMKKLIDKRDEKALETKIKDLQNYFDDIVPKSREITNKIINEMEKSNDK